MCKEKDDEKGKGEKERKVKAVREKRGKGRRRKDRMWARERRREGESKEGRERWREVLSLSWIISTFGAISSVVAESWLC